MKLKSAIAFICALALFSACAWGQGASGSTLQASKTLNICLNTDGKYLYRGEVSVWNTGANAAEGLSITDCLQYKAAGQPGQPTDLTCLSNIQGTTTTIPGLTQETNALTFPYSFTLASFDPAGTYRNSAQVNITNHSGGQVAGPNPKYTWTGGTPPACQQSCGCTYTQGYWDNKPGVVWPAPYDRNALFFNSGLTWQQIMDASVAGGNAYVNLAHQYIAAVLNVARGACHSSDIDSYINLATGFFSGYTAGSSFCASGGPGANCSLQVTWAGILADYNQGTGAYANNPGHCGNE